MSRLRILVADDHDLVSAGLEMLINREPDMEVICRVVSGDDAIKKAIELRPDLVIMDLNMENTNGTEATGQIIANLPSVKVLAISIHDDRYHLKRVLSKGASGFCPKSAVVSDLISAIRTVASGGVYIHPNLSKGLVALLNEKSGREYGRLPRKELSEREGEVIRLLALGYSNKEVAAQLKVGVKSVDTYKTRSMEKLGLKSRVEIVRYARQQGLLDEF
jgi:two-component system, NarL family, response regulator NreC